MSAKDEVLSIFNKSMELYNSDKKDELVNLYSNNLVIYWQNSKPVKGKDCILDLLKAREDYVGKVDVKETDFEQFSDTIAQLLVVCRMYDASGKHILDSKGIIIWRKENGQWRIYRECFNTSNPE